MDSTRGKWMYDRVGVMVQDINNDSIYPLLDLVLEGTIPAQV